MSKRSERRSRPDPTVRHGTIYRYRRGCSCDECREAARVKNERNKASNRARGPEVHGTEYVYQKYGCRCDACRSGAADARAARRAAILASPIPKGQHGKLNTYDAWGCRCTKCKAAKAEWRRMKRIDAGLPVLPAKMTRGTVVPRALPRRQLVEAAPTGRCEVCGKVGFDFLGGRRCYAHRPGGLMGTLV